MEYLAHVKETNSGKWEKHLLSEHLEKTAQLAGEFAAEFGSGDWAELAGLWHDLGKFLPEWQNYLCNVTGYNPEASVKDVKCSRINHSDAGMRWGFLHWGEKSPQAKIMAYLIGGHHAGLPDWSHDDAGGDLVNRLPLNISGAAIPTKENDKINEILKEWDILQKDWPKSTPLQRDKVKDPQSLGEHFHLWVRMLYSCLVDADFLDTEAFMDPHKSSLRKKPTEIQELLKKINDHLGTLTKNAPKTPVNQVRAEVLNECQEAAHLEPGFFSLNVPTGGGKTLASMAFALKHAAIHKKKRVVMAIPYTSIIEQTASVYRDVFGADNIIEHHSNLDPEKESVRSRLAAENWDAPIIVTTNVQLFESLFASRSSACRKLHNIVNSVIILDETQVLPPEFLQPILSTLQGLVDAFGVSVVFCTATEPTLEGVIGSDQAKFNGIPPEKIRQIIKNPSDLSKKLQRVKIDTSQIDTPVSDWKEISEQLLKHKQVLCIVNTRRDCKELHELMPKDTVHLSALMCPEERSSIIKLIKEKLKNNAPIRVVSTQLVEAGVDIDFPVVYRALAGLDSIAQAAGRCNREGLLNAKGKFGEVVIFAPPKPAPPGLLRKGEDAAKSVLQSNREIQIDPVLFRKYFNSFYSKVNNFDKPGFKERMINEYCSAKFQFRSLSKVFNLIDDTGKTVIVHISENENSNLKSNSHLIDELERLGPNRDLMRRLARYSVNLPIHQTEKLIDAGLLSMREGFLIAEPDAYLPGKGLQVDLSIDGSGIYV